MNVLIATHYFAPHTGGIETVARNQAAGLVAAGHDVTVLTSSCGSQAGPASQNGYRIRRVAALNLLEKKFGVPFPLFSPALVWQSYRLVRKADVVHVHDAFYLSSLAAALWARVLKKPLVLTQHVEMIPHPSALVTLIQKLVYRTSGRFIMHSSRKVMVLNSTVKRFVIAQGVPAARIVHLPNSVDTATFYPGTAATKRQLRKKYQLPTAKPVVLFVGRFVPKKGFTELLKLPAADYTVAFVGGNAPADAPAGSRFIFLGELPPSAVAELYRTADIFVLPSTGEGFPLTAQEAMASGLPVILANDPGYQAYHFDRHLFTMVPPKAARIHAAIERISTSKALQKRISAYALAYTNQHFSAGAHQRALLAVYDEARA